MRVPVPAGSASSGSVWGGVTPEELESELVLEEQVVSGLGSGVERLGLRV